MAGKPDRGEARVALFVTCLVDLFRPQVGFAAIRLLERAGYTVEVPVQGCCGQPNFNGGDRSGAQEIAAGVIRRFADYDYVVAPSGSCAAMIRRHYPALFPAGSDEQLAARAMAEKTHELTGFLCDVAGLKTVEATWPASITFHDGCAGLRELGIRRQPRDLLHSVAGLELHELNDPEACCGFGGTFCVKYPEISNRIAGSKVADVLSTGADYLVAGELGCLLQIEGKLHRDGHPVRAVHLAEVLAGTAGDPTDKSAPRPGQVGRRSETVNGND